MLKLYCPSCGSANEYVSNKPKFCGQCQKTLNISSAEISYKTPEKSIIQKSKYEFDIEEETDIDVSAFEIEAIDKSIRHGVTLGEVTKQQKTGFKRDIPNINLTKEQILENFQKEAAPSKRIIEDIEE